MGSVQIENESLKFMRKGTRACRECRRRKIRCIYPNNDQNSVCRECFEHDRGCTKQGFVRSGGKGTPRNMRVKIARLESAVQRLARWDPDALDTIMPQLYGLKDSPKPMQDHELEFPEQLFQRNDPLFQLLINESLTIGSTDGSVHSKDPNNLSTLERIQTDRVKLLETIYPITNLQTILQDAGDWWIAWREQLFNFRQVAVSQTLADFVNEKLRDSSPVVASVGLLTIAMALQHVDLPTGASPVSQTDLVLKHMETISAAVAKIVLDSGVYKNHPDIAMLYMLRAKLHAETNQLRKSWLRIRQAIDAAQDMGIGSSRPVENRAIGDSAADQQRFMGAIMEIFSFLSMLLGLPHASDENFTDTRAFNVLLKDPTGDSDMKMRALRRVIAIAATNVNDKNANRDMSDITTQDIQSSLDLAAGSMPRGWWELAYRPMVESAQHRFEHLSVQVWFWVVQAFLHLPHLMEKPQTPNSLHYQELCLDACRNMLRLFNYLRSGPGLSLYVSNCDDFQGLIGGCILMVGVLQKLSEENLDPDTECALDNDMQLIEELMDIFRYRAHRRGGSINEQGLAILEEMTLYVYAEDKDEDSTPRVKTMMLPYFGTINIQLAKKLPRANRSSQVSLKKMSSAGQNDEHRRPKLTTGGSLPNTTTISGKNEEFFQPELDIANSGPSPDLFFETLPQIDWDQWDHFCFNNELGQDWNLDLALQGSVLT